MLPRLVLAVVIAVSGGAPRETSPNVAQDSRTSTDGGRLIAPTDPAPEPGGVGEDEPTPTPAVKAVQAYIGQTTETTTDTDTTTNTETQPPTPTPAPSAQLGPVTDPSRVSPSD